jgi:hypothetical protein
MRAIFAQFPTFLAFIRFLFRLLPIVAAWLVVVVVVTSCVLAARGVDTDLFNRETVELVTSIAVGSAVAAAVALAVGRKRRLAGAVVAASVLVTVVTAALMYALLYVDPWSLRNQMDAWSFLRLRNDTWNWVANFARVYGPFAAWAGIVAGSVCGLLCIVARRRPNWALFGTLALFFALAVEPVQALASTLSSGVYWTIRLSASAWTASVDKTSELGAWCGAIVGALIAGVVIEITRRKQERASSGPT